MLARVRDPRAAGRWPAGQPGVASGEAGAEEDGILIRLQLLRPGSSPRVQEARFQAFGCPVAIACASWLAEWAGGKSLDAVAALSASELAAALELAADDAPTAELALAALRAALAQARVPLSTPGPE